MADRGVKTPVLYAWGQGELLEEDVPWSLLEAIARVGEVPESILLGLAKLAGIVASLGFLPVELFDDLRGHGDDVVMVDFGQDLGPPSAAKGQSSLFSQLVNRLDAWRIPASLAYKNRLRSVFEAHRRAPGMQ